MARSCAKVQYARGFTYQNNRSRTYPRGLPYLKIISTGTTESGTPYCTSPLKGMPPTVPLTKWLTMFINAATPSTTNRSSNSSPINVTLWCKFRFTGVTSSAIVISLAHSCGSVLDPKFRQTQNSRQTEAGHGRNCIPRPGFANRHALEQPSEVQDHHHDLNNSVEGQHDVADPVHQGQDGHPVTVRIVGSGLLGECFE